MDRTSLAAQRLTPAARAGTLERHIDERPDVSDTTPRRHHPAPSPPTRRPAARPRTAQPDAPHRAQPAAPPAYGASPPRAPYGATPSPPAYGAAARLRRGARLRRRYRGYGGYGAPPRRTRSRSCRSSRRSSGIVHPAVHRLDRRRHHRPHVARPDQAHRRAGPRPGLAGTIVGWVGLGLRDRSALILLIAAAADLLRSRPATGLRARPPSPDAARSGAAPRAAYSGSTVKSSSRAPSATSLPRAPRDDAERAFDALSHHDGHPHRVLHPDGRDHAVRLVHLGVRRRRDRPAVHRGRAGQRRARTCRPTRRRRARNARSRRPRRPGRASPPTASGAAHRGDPRDRRASRRLGRPGASSAHDATAGMTPRRARDLLAGGMPRPGALAHRLAQPAHPLRRPPQDLGRVRRAPRLPARLPRRPRLPGRGASARRRARRPPDERPRRQHASVRARAVRWTIYIALAIVFAIACAFLSNWQFTRNAAARGAARARRRRTTTPSPSRSPSSSPPADELDPADEWRPVALDGEYLADDQLLARNRAARRHRRLRGARAVPPRRRPRAARSTAAGCRPVRISPMPDAVPAPPEGEVTVIARLRPGEPLPASGRSAPEGQVPTINLGSSPTTIAPDVGRRARAERLRRDGVGGPGSGDAAEPARGALRRSRSAPVVRDPVDPVRDHGLRLHRLRHPHRARGTAARTPRIAPRGVEPRPVGIAPRRGARDRDCEDEDVDPRRGADR